jgi:hypothetical protein
LEVCGFSPQFAKKTNDETEDLNTNIEGDVILENKFSDLLDINSELGSDVESISTERSTPKKATFQNINNCIADIDDIYNEMEHNTYEQKEVNVVNGPQLTVLENGWFTGAQLTALLYQSEIKNENIFIGEVSKSVSRLIYWLEKLCPKRLENSYKLPLLYFLPSDIYLNGLSRLSATEMQKGTNRVIRKSIQQSMMINPSKDVQLSFKENMVLE